MDLLIPDIYLSLLGQYIADTCGVNTSTECVKEMESQVAAYEESKAALIRKVVPMGGEWAIAPPVCSF